MSSTVQSYSTYDLNKKQTEITKRSTTLKQTQLQVLFFILDLMSPNLI